MITVAIATLDRPASLARCLTAVLNGSSLPAEIVIVDQSADTRTADVVEGCRAASPVPVRYIRQLRRGLAASRNLAVAYSTGDVIAFTDDDCVPDRDWIAGIAAAFCGPERPQVVTGRILPYGPERPGIYAVSSRVSTVPRTCRGRVLPWAIGSGGNTAVDRRWLLSAGGFDEELGAGSRGRAAEDTDLLYRVLAGGGTVQYDPATLVFHERQGAARRMASRPAYGFGMGAFCAKWARRGHAFALWMLFCWVAQRVIALAAATLRLRARRVREELLMLAGACRGVASGLVFAPVHRACAYDLPHGSSSSV